MKNYPILWIAGLIFIALSFYVDWRAAAIMLFACWLDNIARSKKHWPYINKNPYGNDYIERSNNEAER